MFRVPAPAHVHAVATEVIAALPAHRQELFHLRLDRWWQDLSTALEAAYGRADADALALRSVRLAAGTYRDRDPELHRLDLERALEPDWFQSPAMVGYAGYTDRFAGDLRGLTKHIDYLRELGVTYLHLMPLLQSREGDNDGGYAVSDYRSVRSDLGTMADLKELSAALRRAGISLVLDLVLNHVAREHAWAVAARAGDEHYRSYFYVFPDRYLPDAYERTLPQVFPDFAPGNFTWDEDLASWVWTTFNSWQWDLNWSNPDVFVEFADVVFFLANTGVEVIRLDAIAFLWKRMGTNCQNQPEVHCLTQALRALARIACPALIFKAEAIVGPADLVQYLGRGHHYGKVSDLAYHNTLMVQIWSMLAAGNAVLAAHALRELPRAPTTTAWITYVRCHDDIGWAIDDRDAADVGLNGFAHRAFLSDFYAGEYPTSTARGLVFQHNPATGDRRISGTTASLAGVESAASAGDADSAVGRVLLAYAIVYGWGGIPVIWSGDELALVNDVDWASETGHEHDNRWAHRPRLSWTVAEQRHDASTVPGRVFEGLSHLADVRARLPYLHAAVRSEVPELSDPGVLPIVRRHPAGTVLELYNVTATWRPWPADRVRALGVVEPVELISDEQVPVDGDGNLWLPPYAAWWLVSSH